MVKKKKRKQICKGCKKLFRQLSRKGYCSDCSIERATNSILQLQAKKGEIYELWHDNVIKAMKKLDRKKK